MKTIPVDKELFKKIRELLTLQGLTTKEPDEGQTEVAAEALRVVLRLERPDLLLDPEEPALQPIT